MLGPNRTGIVLLSATVGIVIHFVVRFVKATQDELTRELAMQVNLDPVTGTLSRRGLMNALALHPEPESRPAWCAYIDIDYFKSINDQFGHSYGDSVLADVGTVLKDANGDDDLVARLGGDEFVVMGAGVAPDEFSLESQLNKQLMSATNPCHLSVGMATERDVKRPLGEPSPTGTINFGEELIKLADHRMYSRRRARRGEEVPESRPARHHRS